jgi:PKD domain
MTAAFPSWNAAAHGGWELWKIDHTRAMRTRLRFLLCLTLLLCMGLTLGATSTSGTTARAVNVADGIITPGAMPGTNGADWELDERFQGFSGAVDWFVTWDDTNLYLGRAGGNNAEGSILYIHAEYAGATFASRAFNYDNLQPEVSAMGGVNFATYLKSSAHEYRTYAGAAWSAATPNTLAPHFTSQSVGDNMEVAIPWSAITAGNGIPTSIRFALYQVAPTSVSCGQHFVYGESPWGTGAANDGPSVGVNDGVPISARQPGGCGVGSDTLRRWWGCYPVVSGVGGNAWTFERNISSINSDFCTGASTNTLIGDGGSGQGFWTQLSGPATLTLTNANNATTSVTNVTVPGQYVFLFTRAVTCQTVHDTVHLTVAAQPQVTQVVIDGSQCPIYQFSLQLQGNATSYDWDMGAGAHVFTANPVFDYTPYGNGNYPVQVVVANACGTDTATGMAIVNCLTAVDAGLMQGLQHSPNPSRGVVEVDLGANAGNIMQVKIVDLLGRNMPAVAAQYLGHHASLDFAAYAVGTYYVILELSDGSRVGFMQRVE